ncbi:MAG: hypothetical protein AB1458_06780 [Bacteroidota bacterium]
MRIAGRMLSAIRKYPSRAAICLCAIACLFLLLDERVKDGFWKDTIASDGKGYYAYLPAIFIYQDLQYSFSYENEKKYHGSNEGPFFCNEIDGKRVNKYFAGEALLLLPFFLLAFLLSWFFGYDLDGYSQLFQHGVSIGAVFYLVIGLLFTRRLLLFYVSEILASFTLLLIFFGTNLLYYSVFEASISHVYSFGVMAAFLYYLRQALVMKQDRCFLWSAWLLALVVLIRPSNGIILLAAPLIAGSFPVFRDGMIRFFRNARLIVFSLAGCLAILSVQILLYYFQSGRFFIWSYGEEGFNFTQPEIMNVLFSYRKGFFVYTPLALVALLGLVPLWHRSRFEFFSMLLLLFVMVWVIASWWMWFYGGSFGQRAFVEYYSLFALLLALLLKRIAGRRWLLCLFAPILGFVVLLCQVQTYQKYRLILPWDGMTMEKYWKIFLRTDDKYIGMFTPNAFIPDEWSLKDRIRFFNDFDPGYEWWDMHTLSTENSYSGKYSSMVNGKNKKSVTFAKRIRDVVPDTVKEAYVRANIMAWTTDWDSDADLVISFESGGKSYSWNTFKLNRLVQSNRKWSSMTARIKIPELVTPDDIVTVYVLSHDGTLIYLDDFEVLFLIYPAGAYDNKEAPEQ